MCPGTLVRPVELALRCPAIDGLDGEWRGSKRVERVLGERPACCTTTALDFTGVSWGKETLIHEAFSLLRYHRLYQPYPQPLGKYIGEWVQWLEKHLLCVADGRNTYSPGQRCEHHQVWYPAGGAVVHRGNLTIRPGTHQADSQSSLDTLDALGP